MSLTQPLFTSPRRGEVGMCAPRVHIPGEGVTALCADGPLSPGSRKRDPTSPAEVGSIRLRPALLPNSGKPEFGRGEVTLTAHLRKRFDMTGICSRFRFGFVLA